MPRGSRRPLAIALAALLLAPGAGIVVDVAPVRAVGTVEPWYLPTVPPTCTSSQVTAGNVAGCVITLTNSPESRGWPTAPFPVPLDPTTVAWTDVAKGASGTLVKAIQEALIAAGYSLTADGQFGPITEARVMAFQTDQGLPSTGIVDEATATALGVSATSGGTFPPPGWNWLGWGYNGSPALADWETKITGNLAAIGPVKSGQMRLMPEALPLFEGFISEIVAGGYLIKELGGYVFRCTASTAKSCAGLTRAALSNHAYGLAIDFNTVANPMATYYGINGATACATPVKTDIPQWVVQTAEKWGLYWGGYGWSSGCKSPTQVKSSASRDPMHFEYNGTPAQAKAILAYNQANNVPIGAPANCVKLVNDSGVVTRCLKTGELPPAGSRVMVETDAPSGSQAALVNLTLTDPAGAGYVTAETCAAQPAGMRSSSNGNMVAGRAAANLAVVPLDANGRFCLYLSTRAHVLVDVQGYFAAAAKAPTGSTFVPLPPQRVIDTRSERYCDPSGSCVQNGPVSGGYKLAVNAPRVPSGASALLANLTVTETSSAGYTTADACAALVNGLQSHSNVNYGKGATVANLAVVPATATDAGAQFCTYSSAAAHAVVDVQGYFAPGAPGGLGYSPLGTASRLVDTRGCWTDPVTGTQRCQKVNAAGSIVRMKAPPGASAVLVNLTLTDASSGGYATADRCSAITPGPQAKSSANATPGAVIANLAVVAVDGDGTFCVYVSSPMHLIVDLQGSFAAGSGLLFSAIAPVRSLDTRLAKG